MQTLGVYSVQINFGCNSYNSFTSNWLMFLLCATVDANEYIGFRCPGKGTNT